jgi:catechol 2,3-dioxygenase-like lactoylglutathione lyase family enzyme
MHETLLNKYAINQLGYVVPDLKQACLDYSKLFGVGPFFYIDPPYEGEVTYRGKKTPLKMALAYAEYGDLQIEFMQVLSKEPNVYSDLGHFGLQHVCIWVDDFDAACKEFEDAGFEQAMLMDTGGGMTAYYDCVDKWGYFVEVQEPMPILHDVGKDMRDEWDGTRPYRALGED